jgi:hypothetical protein
MEMSLHFYCWRALNFMYAARTPSFSDTPLTLSLLLYFLFIFRLFSLTHTHSPGVYARVNFNSLAQSSGVQIGNPAVFAWRARERKG